MKIRSPIARRRTRLEIIPLIDIMFFLLASFMMVSLQMQKVRTLKASLPTATQITSATKPDMIKLKVDPYGLPSVDNQPLSFSELGQLLAARLRVNTNVPVYLSGSRNSTHGQMVYVLNFIKQAGVQRVAFAVKADPNPSVSHP
jgi:biopolymer transport protein ExbD